MGGDNRLIAITGTPGTGKSSVASIVGNRLDMRVVDLNKEIQERDAFRDVDASRDAIEVEIEELVDTFMDEWGDDVIVESHLSHFFPTDEVVVLRCHPDELHDRLVSRDWSADKVEENMESEAIDMVLQEAVDFNEDVFEVDTTGKSADAVAETVLSVLEGDAEDFRPGQVDWSDTLGDG